MKQELTGFTRREVTFPSLHNEPESVPTGNRCIYYLLLEMLLQQNINPNWSGDLQVMMAPQEVEEPDSDLKRNTTIQLNQSIPPVAYNGLQHNGKTSMLGGNRREANWTAIVASKMYFVLGYRQSNFV